MCVQYTEDFIKFPKIQFLVYENYATFYWSRKSFNI